MSGLASDDEAVIDEDVEMPGPSRVRLNPKVNMYTPRLVGALDKCKVTNGNAVHLISATIDSLKLNVGDYILSRASIKTYRRQYREEIANESLRSDKVISIIFSY